MSATHRAFAPGPFRADQIRPGEPYELSNGHRIQCLPTGQRGGRANLTGAAVLESDPAVVSAGIDVGYSDEPGRLRAPDVSVGNVANEPGWAKNAPPLAVEYADRGQDQQELKDKLAELLAGGAKHVWVVRLTGPRRVEVHEPHKAMRLAFPGELLTAPGILKNAVAVEELYDRDAAHEAVLRNILQRKGYENLDAVRAEGVADGVAEGKAEGRAEALLDLLDLRHIALSSEQRTLVQGTRDRDLLRQWFARAAVATTAAEVFESDAQGG